MHCTKQAVSVAYILVRLITIDTDEVECRQSDTSHLSVTNYTISYLCLTMQSQNQQITENRFTNLVRIMTPRISGIGMILSRGQM